MENQQNFTKPTVSTSATTLGVPSVQTNTPITTPSQPVAQYQGPITAQDSQSRPKINRKLLVIFLVIFLFLGGLAYAWFFTDLKDNISFLKSKEITDSIKTEEANIATSTEDMVVDYTKKETLAYLIPCYIYKYPEASQYFPEGKLRDIFAMSPAERESTTEEPEYMTTICLPFEQKAYDYALTLLKTDDDKDGLNLFLENMYRTSDNNVDTDGDTYPDLTEVLTDHDPNNLFTAEYKAKMSKIETAIRQPSFDVNEMVALCKSFEDATLTDPCFEFISSSPYLTDVTFCDTVGFSDELSFKGDCKENFLMRSGKPEDCLGVGGSGDSICLSQYIEKEKSLRPCMLVGAENFSVCVGGYFHFLDQVSDCNEYKQYLDDYLYDSCLFDVAVSTKDPKACDGVIKMGSSECIRRLAYNLKDPSICEHYDKTSNDDSFLYKRCISNTPDGRNIDTESGYLAFCNSYPDIIDKGNCFADLAKLYNKEKYCVDSATILTKQWGYQRSLESCYYNLIVENSRKDLCKLVTAQRHLDREEYKSMCN